MGFKIGQLISTDITEQNPYLSTLKDNHLTITGIEKSDFEKVYIGLKNNVNFQKDINYYLKIIINNQTITSLKPLNIFLIDSSNENQPKYSITDPRQYIFKNINFILNTENTQHIIEFIFCPNTNNYNTIVFQGDNWLIQEQSNQSLLTNNYINSWTISNFNLVNNLLINKSKTKEVHKFGIQGTPGLMFCINKEQLRIGPNGIYEIKNNYLINNIGVAKTSNNQKFIIDYLYEENENVEGV